MSTNLPAASPTTTPRKARERDAAHGNAHVLSIGVSDYPKRSNLRALPVCVNDAARVIDRFLNVRELNADPAHCNLLQNPSRGRIIVALQELAEHARADDRIVVFYSGHGLRIGDGFYFAPNDAYKAAEPAALVSLDEVKTILAGSPAKQKLIILDACYSGPDTTGQKGPLEAVSHNEFVKQLASARGFSVLSSSALEETSTTQSADGRVSLFTDHLTQALGGAAEALEDGLLTLSSLYAYLSRQVAKSARSFGRAQRPGIEQAAQGISSLVIFDRLSSALPSSIFARRRSFVPSTS